MPAGMPTLEARVLKEFVRQALLGMDARTTTLTFLYDSKGSDGSGYSAQEIAHGLDESPEVTKQTVSMGMQELRRMVFENSENAAMLSMVRKPDPTSRHRRPRLAFLPRPSIR